ncbi:MAG TPA: S53 family peptidase [Candidatus Binataceae bacterium]|nr:S53 family peptidase [Candidatus Binataceae bacterium]
MPTQPSQNTKRKQIARHIAAITVAISFAVAIVPLSAARAQNSSPYPAASATASEAATTIVGDHPDEAADFASGPEIAGSKTLRMRISLALHNQDALRKLIAAQQDPSSPEYHQWLTPDQFAARFGPTQSELSMVSAWLTGKGFTVESASASKRAIVFSGPASLAESVFKVKIHTDESGKLFVNLGDPSIPASIAPLVGSIEGLSNILRAHPNLKFAPAATASPNVTIGSSGTHFGPNDLYTFYDQTPPTNSSVDGTGAACIALIEVSDFDNQSVDAFDTQFGIEPINLTRVFPNSNPGVISNTEIEALLDVEYSHAAAPGVPTHAYIGNDSQSPSGSGLLDAAVKAVNDGVCGAISISFSLCGGNKTFYTSQLAPLFSQAASQGQAVIIAEGDYGAAGLAFDKKANACVPGRSRNVNELSSNPYATAVGGTEFTPNYSGGNDSGDVPESVWNDSRSGNGAGGGGRSRFFKKPLYQSTFIKRDKHRDVPDVSFAASPDNPGFYYAVNGSVTCSPCIGGTSLGTPYWAGITQLAAAKTSAPGGKIGSLNPKLYAIETAGGAGIRDVTLGNNTFIGLHSGASSGPNHRVPGFKATVGYDKASGLGTPDIELLLGAIAAQ